MDYASGPMPKSFARWARRGSRIDRSRLGTFGRACSFEGVRSVRGFRHTVVRIDHSEADAIRVGIGRHLVPVRAAQLIDVVRDPRTAADDAQQSTARATRVA